MFGLSGEHLLVLLVILLIFGPRRLPELGHSIGRTLKNFKDGMNNQMEQNNTTAAAPYRAPEARQTASAEPVAPVTATTATPAAGPASAEAQASETRV